ncbi:hypothetical protein CONLIGDRAFT_687802 [Coniochaeta ligniaria NRRL 30616]|uniref:Uncharacterized protein n=1 Tax=Coniochaeta ligniaria NRRL 30616 TaxID=1408157 RepID=A0A1J7I473_9PEZI|nr:hypothetical protein CONLIGDRAFT_687802 [Coniochaeta ligniaria NRRL 30616]
MKPTLSDDHRDVSTETSIPATDRQAVAEEDAAASPGTTVLPIGSTASASAHMLPTAPTDPGRQPHNKEEPPPPHSSFFNPKPQPRLQYKSSVPTESGIYHRAETSRITRFLLGLRSNVQASIDDALADTK